MNATKSTGSGRPRRAGGPRRPRSNEGADKVSDLHLRRIEKSLDARTRYKYVHPRVVREGLGWKVVCPNCSRNIDPQGAEIDIAWLVPEAAGGWLLYSRDHAHDCWQLRLHAPTLSPLLDHLCADPQREFWQ